MFRDVVRIAEYHKPKILFLENVKHLLKHDNGNTFKIIKYNIENIGYNMYYKVCFEKNIGEHLEKDFNDLINKFKEKFPKINEYIK